MPQSNREKVEESITNLRKFVSATNNLKKNTLPNMKAGFGIDDIFTLGLTEILKQSLNSTINTTINLITDSTPRPLKLISDLTVFEGELVPLTDLGEFVTFFKKRAMMIATVQVFVSPNLAFEADKLAEIANIVDIVGKALEGAATAVGFPEVSVALEVALGIFDAIVSFVELAQKKSKVEELQTKLEKAYNAITVSSVDVEHRNKEIIDIFKQLQTVLEHLGKKFPAKPTQKTIIAQYTDMQDEFETTYNEYESVKKYLGDKTKRDSIVASFKNVIGYGTVTRATFFLVLYAEDSLPEDQVTQFLTDNLKQIPAGGIGHLVQAIAFVKKTLTAQH